MLPYHIIPRIYWANIMRRVTVIDAFVGHEVTTLPAENVYELGFSPFGTYIITWQRMSKDEEGNAVKNLKVWRTVDEGASASGSRDTVGSFVQRNQTGWNLQYTSDEKYCARVVTNEVQFYESGDLKTVWNKLRVEGVTDFAVAPGNTHSVAVFVPERKGQPAAVKVFTVPQFATPVSQKTFFKGDKVQFKWNEPGTSLIVLASTDVDKSNKSYYGETNMYILSASGGFDSRIALGTFCYSPRSHQISLTVSADKEGPVHDVSWSPNGKEFGVVYGYMPAKTTIFNARAVATHNFPLAPRNTISFSPHGRFVLVAGFGNLAGQMDIYDLEKNYTKICTIEASNASVCEWSPDGTHILTATTSPRLRVDNGVRIWHVGGGVMYNEDMNELYHITWRPQSAASLPLVADPVKMVPTPHASALAYMGTKKVSTKPTGAYRPPGARGTSTPLAFKREDEGGAAYSASNGIRPAEAIGGGINGFGKTRRFVPGAEPTELPPGAAPGGGVSLTGTGEGADGEGLSKAALKNKKKREAKKAKEAAERESGKLEVEGLENVPKGPRAMSRSPERGAQGARHHQRNKSGYEMGQGHGQGRSPHRRERGASHSRQRGDSNLNGHPNGQSRRQPPPNLAQTQTPALAMPPPPTAESAAAPDLTVTSPGGGMMGGEQGKKIRSLLKKIRAIDELKMRQAAGEKLEDTQVKKIATEEGVRRELAGLGFEG